MGKKATRNQAKEKWIEQVGSYWYFSLVLAGFNPVVADEIFDKPAHVIAEAFVSMMAYNYVDQK